MIQPKGYFFMYRKLLYTLIINSSDTVYVDSMKTTYVNSIKTIYVCRLNENHSRPLNEDNVRLLNEETKLCVFKGLQSSSYNFDSFPMPYTFFILASLLGLLALLRRCLCRLLCRWHFGLLCWRFRCSTLSTEDTKSLRRWLFELQHRWGFVFGLFN